MPTSGAQTTVAVPAPVTGPFQVAVQEVEYKITMPTSISAGQVVFTVTNNGTTQHSFVIQGQGVNASLPHALNPGESGTLQVTLTPGTYTVFCPIDGHADQGMRLQVTVTGS